ncbi:sodium:solute symporter family transporter [Rufibacter quisquiliarum]|uniref:SSS family transporter n=1 Tax=Rufibacter quisquiliarum TaxID=1549639 RepID=A0A839GLC5_9BACT|nr:sodium:solute symporter [Rufibacter quisquiliarum]MBA9075747.1 SSS family transporter [Rufibacter quisquiliarum]
MSKLDWGVLVGTIAFIVIYGVWKTRHTRNMQGFLKADNTERWWMMGLSIMATQASAITFLSTPGQAFDDGMRFIQFYFGLPLAMVVLSITAIPIYYRLKVYTAYEYLESRFDLKTRSLAAFLFLLQRGLSTGITIYAPAIILSAILGWNLTATILFIGVVVIFYTVVGGTKAVSQTQRLQMTVMLGGMLVAAVVVVRLLPEGVGFSEALVVAGKMGKLNLVDLKFNPNDRYNVWSGLIGGFFLSLSYFGTDQSQVGRYLGGETIAQSRLGLLMNGLVKVPMQFLILLVGVLVFVFYQFHQPPLYFNQQQADKVRNSDAAPTWQKYEATAQEAFTEKREAALALVKAHQSQDAPGVAEAARRAQLAETARKSIRAEAQALVKAHNNGVDLKDTDYVFLTFVTQQLPRGLVGLLLAVVLCAAMGSTASAFSSLASTTVVDVYKRSLNKTGSDQHYVNASRWFTIGWGTVSIFFALFASQLENLIQAVNILGSLFYGTILGVFVAAFYFKRLTGNPVFWAAVLTQGIIFLLYYATPIAYLWYNLIGCVLVVVLAYLLQPLLRKAATE